MARKSRMAVLKRQREQRKAEKAAIKRERREQRESDAGERSEDQVATQDDLEGYGFAPPPPGEAEER